jgi:hypothetical protein
VSRKSKAIAAPDGITAVQLIRYAGTAAICYIMAPAFFEALSEGSVVHMLMTAFMVRLAVEFLPAD